MISIHMQISNNVLPIYLDNSSESLFIDNLRHELNAFQELNIYEENIVIACLVASSLIGSYFKSSLYFYFSDRFRAKGNTPIDVLILVNAIIQHSVTIFLTLNYSVGLIFDVTFSDCLSETWCNIIWYAGVFGGAYRVIGSLGLAILRIIYIKSHFIISDPIGRKKISKVMLTILILTLLVSFGLTIGFGMGNGPASRRQVTWNWCIGSSEELRTIEHSYKMLTGASEPESDTISLLSLGATILAIFLELSCYLALFGHLYFHDSDMLNKKLLRPDDVKARHQKNAITFIGQFYGFIAEIIISFSYMYTYKLNAHINARLAVALGSWIEFGLVSVIEVMTSQNLRRCLPHNRLI